MLTAALLCGSILTMGILIHDEVCWVVEPESPSARQLRAMIALCRLLVFFSFFLCVNIVGWLT